MDWQVLGGGLNERRRLAIPHFTKDIYGRGGAILDGGVGMRAAIHTQAEDRAS